MNAPTPLRLLIVDDNRDFLDAASAVLEHEGLTVVGIASSRAAALRLVAAVEPDVILVDVDLGDESGLDLTERIAATSSTPVILISVYAESELTDLVAASPAVGFLAKSELGAAAISAVLARGARPERDVVTVTRDTRSPRARGGGRHVTPAAAAW